MRESLKNIPEKTISNLGNSDVMCVESKIIGYKGQVPLDHSAH